MSTTDQRATGIKREINTLKTGLRETIMPGGLEIPVAIEQTIDQAVSRLCADEGGHYLRIRPEEREDVSKEMKKILKSIARSLIQTNQLSSSFLVRDNETIDLFTELLFSDYETIRSTVYPIKKGFRNKILPMTPNKLQDLLRIAVYQDSEHVRKILHDDRYLTSVTGWNADEVKKNLPPWIKRRLLFKNTGNPEGAILKMKEHLDKVLHDENLVALTGWSIDEVKDNFTPATKRRIAVFNISDPESAVLRIKDNLDRVLSDENLVALTGWSIDEVKSSFPIRTRKRIAVQMAADPESAIQRIKTTLETDLTDAYLVDLTGWDIAKIRNILHPSLRVNLAVDYKDPKEAVLAIKENLETTLSDTKLVDLTNWSLDDVREIFFADFRLHIASSTKKQIEKLIERIVLMRNNKKIEFKYLSSVLGFELTKKLESKLKKYFKS